MNTHDIICFKAQTWKEHRWIEGDLIHDGNKTMILPFAKIGEDNKKRSVFSVEPETICKNIPFACYNNYDYVPNALYMGDILEVCERHDDFHGNWYVIAENHDTVFGRGYITDRWSGHYHPQDTIRVRVVSNVYDDDASKYIEEHMIEEFKRFMRLVIGC